MDSSKAEAIPDYGWDSHEAEASHDYLQPAILRLVDEAGVGSSALRIFDAGCGNGALLKSLSGRGHIVAGCDASVSGVSHARIVCAANVRIEQLSVYDDLAAVFGSDWDIVIATEVIEHLYNPRAFIQHASNLLRSDGVLILSTPYHGYLKNAALALSGKLDAHFTALWDGGHIKFWSRRTLTQLLGEFGFCHFGFLGVGRFPYLWKSMIVVARKPGVA